MPNNRMNLLHYANQSKGNTMTSAFNQKVKALEAHLPSWSQAYRGMPNALAHSALFGVAHVRSGTRKDYKRHLLASTKGILLDLHR